MRKPRPTPVALAIAAGLVTTLMVPTAAQAAYFGSEVDVAQPSGGPTGSYDCNTWHPDVIVCFKPDGDDFYVLDNKADGHSAAAEWIFDHSGRKGTCVNRLGKGVWGWCNKDYTENQQMVYGSARYEGSTLIDRNLRELTYT